MFHRLHLTVLLLAAATSTFTPTGAQSGEPIRCTCQFEQSSGYTAVGTRAVCSTMSRKNAKGRGESCEIAFGAAITEGPQIAKLKLDPLKYREASFALTQRNLMAVASRSPQLIADGEYLRQAVPACMRATYLRAGSGIEGDTVNALDKEVVDISSEYAGQIADVFRGSQPPFDREWRGQHRLFVEPGAVRFVYAGQIELVAVFYDPTDR